MFDFLKKDEELKRLEEVLSYKNLDNMTSDIIFSCIYKIIEHYKDFEKVKVLVMHQKDFLIYEIEQFNRLVEQIRYLNNPYDNERYDADSKIMYIKKNEKSFLNTLLNISSIFANFDNENILSKLNFEASQIANEGFISSYKELFTDFNSVSWISTYNEKNFLKLFIYIFVWMIGQKTIYEELKSQNLNLDNFFSKILEIYGLKYYFLTYDTFSKILFSKKYINCLDKNEEFKNFKKETLAEINKRLEKLEKIPKKKEEKEKNINEKRKKINHLKLSLRDNELCKRLYVAYSKKNNINYEEYRTKIKDKKRILEDDLNDIIKFTEEKIFFEKNKLNILKQNLAEIDNAVKDTSRNMSQNKIIEILDLDKNNILKNEKEVLNIENYVNKKILNFLDETLDVKKECIKTLNEEKYIKFELKILRYLMHYRINSKTKIMNDEKLNEKISSIIKILLKKLLYINKIIKITENDEINLVVINEVLKTNIIDLEDIRCIVRKEDNKIYISFLDKDIWQAETTITLKQDIKLNIKENKKYKLFK